MIRNSNDAQPLRAPLEDLEQELIRAYVAGAGHDLDELRSRTDAAAHQLLADASRYASAKLSEVEARSHYLHELHGRS